VKGVVVEKITKVEFWLPLILGLTLCGCDFNSDEYEIKSITAAPEFAIPLAHGELTIKDILDKSDSAYLKVYPSGLVYLAYEDTLVSEDVRQLVNIPNLGNINSVLAVPSGTYSPSTTK